ncbi:ATP-binding protein [Nostocoides sp. HKS02]|uniref:AAA family ATPase n=1 Tax=Nostocoides sp. HKS02 TaxID=1813880 RepID=UPI0012B4D72B|nr:ATP-binding protein [Tetrasphaera sp. HKS02]QGN56738.1 AAA family ATPase [Tetrasphaera sp. HKS02]
MSAAAAGTPVEPAVDRLPAGRGREDPRLAAWRDILAGAATAALRAYRAAWSTDDLDDASRATAGVGVLDRQLAARSVRGRTFHDALPSEGTLAAIAAAAGLCAGDEALLAAAWWTAVDPQLAVAFGCLHDDARRRWATPASVRLSLAPLGVDVPVVVGEASPLVRYGLLDPAPGPAHPLTLTAASADLLVRPVRVDVTTRPVAPRLSTVATRLADLVAAGGRVLARCAADDDREALRDAVAGRLGMPVATSPRSPGLSSLLLTLGRELPAMLLGVGESPPDGCVLALGPADAISPPGWHLVDVPAPALTAAEHEWRTALRTAGIRVAQADLTAYASRLPLGERGIAEVVARAVAAARARGGQPDGDDIAAALRGQPRHDPAGLARQVPATTRLADLVLSAGTREGLDEVVAHARWSAAAHEALHLEGVRGRAVVALFHGPSGSGKTAAAEAVAAAVDRDLWVVDLAKVVSKWLGDTQRNLDAVLGAAATAGVVLLFDEADGLFGKRGEVTDARDRYANLEIDHLLQRIELHTGVVVLTSNRPAALDEAFARRIRLSVRFDLPDHRDREELWRRILPGRLLAADTDTAWAAREELSGAAIRAAALSATVLATADGSAVTAAHLETAVRRELEKTRRHLTARTVPRGQ